MAPAITLAPTYSVLTDAADYRRLTTTLASNPTVVSQYCNGSRIPPEFGSMGYQVPPGISDATVPNPIFNLTPAATVDEGNNWINISWGPLSLTNPVTGATLGNYALAAGSPAIDYIPRRAPPSPTAAGASTDFFGNPRTGRLRSRSVDVGAVEFQPPTIAVLSVTPTSLSVRERSGWHNQRGRNVTVTTSGGTSNPVTFTVVAPSLTSIAPNTGARGTSVPVTLTGIGLTGATAVNVSGAGVTVSGLTVVNDTTVTATFTITAGAALTARNVTVVTPGGTTNAVTFTVIAPSLTSIAPTSGVRGTSVPVTLTGIGLTGATAVNVSGAGVTASTLIVVNDTTITATFTISATAALTARNVTVTTPGGATNAVTFTVAAPPVPTLTSITPNTGGRGTAVPVTLTGTNLTGATSIGVSGAGVTVAGSRW